MTSQEYHYIISNTDLKKEIQEHARKVEAFQHLMTGYSILMNLPSMIAPLKSIYQMRLDEYKGDEAEAALYLRRLRELASERGIL